MSERIEKPKTWVSVEIVKAHLNIDLHHKFFSTKDFGKTKITAEQYAKLPIEEKSNWFLEDPSGAIMDSIKNNSYLEIDHDGYELDSYDANTTQYMQKLSPDYLIGKDVKYYEDIPDTENTLEAVVKMEIMMKFGEKLTIVGYSDKNNLNREENAYSSKPFYIATNQSGQIKLLFPEQIAAVYDGNVIVAWRNPCPIEDADEDADEDEEIE